LKTINANSFDIYVPPSLIVMGLPPPPIAAQTGLSYLAV
jgi:hypothetical protein